MPPHVAQLFCSGLLGPRTGSCLVGVHAHVAGRGCQEWIVHGSEGNGSEQSRDTLIMAYRAKSMIQLERSVGFRHSYNDPEEVLRLVREHVWE